MKVVNSFKQHKNIKISQRTFIWALILSITFNLAPPFISHSALAGPACHPACDGRDRSGNQYDVYCTAMEGSDHAAEYDLKSLIPYSIAGGLCLLACALEGSVIGAPAAAVITGACNASGAVGLGFDMVGTAKIADDGIQNWWSGQVPGVVTSYGEVSQKDVAPELAGTAIGGAGVATNIGASTGAIDSALTKGGNIGKATRYATCAAGVLYSTAAILKGVNYSINNQNTGTLCTTISCLQGGGGAACVNAGANQVPSFDLGHATSPAGTTTQAAGQQTQIRNNDGKKKGMDEGIAFFDQEKRSNATADPLLKNIQNPQALNDALNQMGTNVGDIANQLANGASPSSVMSSLASSMGDGLPDGVKTAMNNLEGLARGGKVSWPGLSAAYSSGGGGPVSGGSDTKMPDLSAMFGKKDDQGRAPAAELLTFGKQAPKLDPTNGDIWHTNYKGSIFDIITAKLQTDKDRVEKLEWASPLNRALMGLPKKH